MIHLKLYILHFYNEPIQPEIVFSFIAASFR